MKKYMKSIAILLCTILTSGCSASRPNADPQAFTTDSITVTYVKSPLNIPSIVEKQKEIFAKQFARYELPVNYANLTTGPEQTQALASGDVQFLYAVGATSVILSAANGADIKIISMYSRSPKAFQLFSKENNITSPNDLKGKTIAGPKGTILHELLASYLATSNLTEEDVQFIPMGIPEAQAALSNGSVDAALLAGSAAFQMEQAGYPVVTTGEGLVDATIVSAVSDKFYQQNKKLIDTFLSAQQEILQYIDKNPEETLTCVVSETGFLPEEVKTMAELYDFDVTIRESDMESMKKTEQFMYQTGMIDQHVDVEQLLIK